jgi:hypothetical protein
MNKNLRVVLTFAGVVLIAAASAVAGSYFGSPTKDSAESETRVTAAYISPQLHFSIEYPAALDEIDEYPGKVIFRIKNADDLSGFGVLVTNVPFSSTQDWLDAQPRGSASAAGYQPVLWMNETAVVAEYLVVDYDGDRPIYAKRMSAAVVSGGKLYKVEYNNQFPESWVPNVPVDMMNVFTSLTPSVGTPLQP